MGFKWSGSWWFSSKSDPRWDCDGHVESIFVTGGMHPDAQAALDKKKEELGQVPPYDLYYRCMKD